MSLVIIASAAAPSFARNTDAGVRNSIDDNIVWGNAVLTGGRR